MPPCPITAPRRYRPPSTRSVTATSVLLLVTLRPGRRRCRFRHGEGDRAAGGERSRRTHADDATGRPVGHDGCLCGLEPFLCQGCAHGGRRTPDVVGGADGDGGRLRGGM